MGNTLRLMALFAAMALSAASSTPYQSKGLRGGVSARPLGPGVYMIDVKVNGFTSRGTALEYAHRKATELCPAGYDVIDGRSDSSVSYAKIGSTYQRVNKPEEALLVQCRVVPPAVAAPGAVSPPWWCSVDATEAYGFCFRDRDECLDLRGRMHASGDIGDIVYGECAGALVATCCSYSGAGLVVEQCYPRNQICFDFRSYTMKETDFTDISECRGVR